MLNPPPATAMTNNSNGDEFNDESFSPQQKVPILPMGLDAESSDATNGTELSAYWKSPQGHLSGRMIPTSAPPINFRPLKWEHRTGSVGGSEDLPLAITNADAKYAEDGFLDNEVMRLGAATVPAAPGLGAGGMFPAGSALRAARTAALH